MAIQENLDLEPNYISIYVVDKKKLAKLLVLARGENRTMVEFAKDCGVSATTFSRILNGNIARPLSPELIRNIAKHAADPYSVNYDALMRANGKVPEGEQAGETKRAEGFLGDEEGFAFKDGTERAKIWSILTEELCDRGCMVRLVKDAKSLLFKLYQNERHGLVPYGDFMILMQGVEPNFWNFMVDYEKCATDAWEKEQILEAVKGTMPRYAQLFLADVWEETGIGTQKHSFVFLDEKRFAAFMEVLKDIKVNGWMSVLLIDTEERRVVREEEIPRYDGGKIESIFEKKKLSQDELWNNSWRKIGND